MKKKMFLVLAAVTIGATMMAGCNSTAEKEKTTEGQTTETEDGETSPEAVMLTESDRQGVLETTGFDIAAPEGATDVLYSYTDGGTLAQISYSLDDATWIYRMQMTDKLTDVSGLSYDWSLTEEGTVSGREAMYYVYSDGDLNKDLFDDVQMVNWYDAVTGVSYSLAVTRSDLNGMDLQVYAEDLYVPLQSEATDDAERDRKTEITDYFLGEHKRSYDESMLKISENKDGTFIIDLNIVRLCNLENGIGIFEDHKMNFEIDDPNGDKMSGVIYRDSDNSLTVKITDSSWGYLPNGEILEGFGK